MKNVHFKYLVILGVLGATWGLTMPVAKVATSTGHAAFGLLAWELIFAILVLSTIMLVRRRPFTFSQQHIGLYIIVAVFGNLIPTWLWFFNAAQLPAGIMSIVISMVPMFSLPVAIILRMEGFQWRRFIGVILGALAIVFLIGPETSLPDSSKIFYVLLALIGPFCYAIEGNWVAKLGFGDLDSVQVLMGASLVALAIAAPITLLSGSWIDLSQSWGRAEYSLLFSSVTTTLAYASFLWLVTRTGAVFSAQVSYLVTGFGVLWSIILLSETYSGWVWLSLILMLGGLFMIRPKEPESLVQPATSGENG